MGRRNASFRSCPKLGGLRHCHDSGNFRVQHKDELSGDEMGLMQLQADNGAPAFESKMFEVPRSVKSEEDLDKYLANQGLKQVQKVEHTPSARRQTAVEAKQKMDDINEWLKADPHKKTDGYDFESDEEA